MVGPRRYRVPKDARLEYRPGEYVPAGAVLWAGIVKAGDHVFVDKVRWNFVQPKRGEIMVFSTAGVAGLPPGTHYIKRMSALPLETVSIDPPHLLIDGEIVNTPEAIQRIASRENGYGGYKLVAPGSPGLLRSPRDEFRLGPAEYFAMGDNTGNSRDSRYWGAVPQQNLVGPAFAVYWPLSSRWGRAR